jgi:hypothetical protein
MSEPRSIDALNRDCQCIGLDTGQLAAVLRDDLDGQGLYASLVDERPHLFSQSAVFVARRHVAEMADVIAAIEHVTQRPAYRERVLAQAPPIARPRPAARGVFMGFDFHMGPDTPQLIEINTNAGGALLSLLVGRAQRACCPPVRELIRNPDDLSMIDAAFVEMFRTEWMLARGANAPLRRIAIVDQQPTEQYLYPEFLLFRQLFRRHGIDAVIAGPESLVYDAGGIRHDGLPVDLVYNRLTDFYLEQPESAALRAAYQDDAVVLTPHPHAHAIYADKRNLALLSDVALLAELGIDAATRDLLRAAVPETEIVRPAAAERLWRQRKHLFFKPAAGYGSKAAYRGEKMTRRVFDAVLAGDYVAQRLVPPSERHVRIDDATVPLKLDVRNYAYAGAVQLLSARLYQGQTTNFRTTGGGFAPVFTEPACG